MKFFKQMFSEKGNILWAILIGAFIVRMCWFVVVEPWTDAAFDRIVTNDQKDYHTLAVNIAQHGKMIVKESDVIEGTFRTPGYPVFIALFYFLFGVHLWLPLFGQILLSLATTYFIYRMANIYFSEKIALLAACLYALEPHSVIYTANLMSETVFTFLVVVSVYTLILSLQHERMRLMALSALLAGIAALVRPIGQYLLLPSLLAIAIFPAIKWRVKALHAYSFVLVFILTITPWLYRNYTQFNVAALSSIKGINLLFYNATYAEAANSGLSKFEVREQFRKQAEAKGAFEGNNPFINSIIYEDIALEYLSSNLFPYAKLHFRGIIHSFAAVDSESTFEIAGADPTVMKYEMQSSGNFVEIVFAFLGEKRLAEVLFAVFVLCWHLLIYSSLLVGTYYAIRNKYYLLLLICIIFTGYFMGLTGILGYVRLKLPVVPFYIMISAAGMYTVYKAVIARWRRHFKKQMPSQNVSASIAA